MKMYQLSSHHINDKFVFTSQFYDHMLSNLLCVYRYKMALLLKFYDLNIDKLYNNNRFSI